MTASPATANPVTGRVIGLARRPARRVPMEVVDCVAFSAGGGLDGDHKGLRFPNRGVTILSAEDWEAAIALLADLAGPVPLPWTVRRANVLVDGIALPKARGGLLALGDVQLEVTAQTYPCSRMEASYPGLLKALAPDWRGGVCCRVLTGGVVAIGDPVTVSHRPIEHRPRLPG